MNRLDLLSRAAKLRSDRVPYVMATVVRCEKPTSAKPGDTAMVLSDGTIEGFVGGTCAESTVRAESMKVLTSRQSTLLVIAPGDLSHGDRSDCGVTKVTNPCLSGGTLEMFLEPEIPDPMVCVFGHGPIAEALISAGALLGFDVRGSEPLDGVPGDAAAVIVATHGSSEEVVISRALHASVPYIGLVASVKRGNAVLSSMGLSSAEIGRIHTPAGIDIGAKIPREVALSIYAEIVSVRDREEVFSGDANGVPETPFTEDLVCGMQVVAMQSSLYLDYGPERYWFCGTGCRDAFLHEPDRYIFPRS